MQPGRLCSLRIRVTFAMLKCHRLLVALALESRDDKARPLGYRLRQDGVALLQENQVARVISLFSLDLICFIPRAEQLASSLLQMFEAEEDGAITEMELAVILKTALGVTHLSVSRLFTAIDSEDTGKITFGERTNETDSPWSLIDLNISKWSLFQTLLCYQRNCHPPFFFPHLLWVYLTTLTLKCFVTWFNIFCVSGALFWSSYR